MSKSIFPEEKPRELTENQEELKRGIYEAMSPRRRKFIDRIGYDVWDPFQEPKEPLDLRKEACGRTIQDLIGEFMRENDNPGRDPAWRKGARDCALGIIQRDEKFQGIFDFCLWYANLLEKEGKFL